MQIVTDSATDTHLLEEKNLDIHIVPLKVTLDDRSYRDGIDISADNFYQVLEESKGLPITSQPSAGEFAELYRGLAKKDPDYPFKIKTEDRGEIAIISGGRFITILFC